MEDRLVVKGVTMRPEEASDWLLKNWHTGQTSYANKGNRFDEYANWPNRF